MRTRHSRSNTALSAALGAGIALLGAGTGAFAAQQAPAPQTAAPAAAARDNTPKRTLSDVLQRMSQAAGVAIVADSTLANERVTLPSEPTTPANFEAQVASLVETLPKGATWAKLYLPAPAGRGYKGDDLADYALAQAKLFGRVGDAPEGTVEVMGKAVPVAQAEALVATLNLKPVYLVANPDARAAAANPAASGGNWATLTEEQRRLVAQNEAKRLAALPPEQRQQAIMNMFGQQGAVMRELFMGMSPEQRQQFFQGMRGMMGSMGGPWGPGGPGRGPGGGGRRGGGNF